MRNIKISPEFQCSPIWINDNINKPFININIEELGMSEELKKLLVKWDKDYQNIYNSAYPPDSSFLNDEDAMDFENGGLHIWELMKKEIKGNITYYSILLNKEYNDIKDLEIDLRLYL